MPCDAAVVPYVTAYAQSHRMMVSAELYDTETNTERHRAPGSHEKAGLSCFRRQSLENDLVSRLAASTDADREEMMTPQLESTAQVLDRRP